jgi:hypothetical protein
VQRQERAKLAITCRGEIGGRALKMFAVQKQLTAYCFGPVGKREFGRVTIAMTVKAGNQRFAKTFRGTLRPS